MTIAAKPRSIEYVEDGATLAFPVPWKFDAGAIRAERQLPGVAIPLAEGTAFSVSGGTTDSGGTLTLSSSIAGATLAIWSETPRGQPTDYETTGAFRAKAHEAALDRQAAVSQEQDREIARGLKVPRGQVGPMIDATTVPDFSAMVALGGKLVLASSAALAMALAPAFGAEFKGDPGSPGEGYPNVGSLQLAGQDALTLDDAYLSQEGRRGKFVFSAEDHSADVAADPLGGIFQPRIGQDGSTGAWVRDIGQSSWFNPEWFGATRARAGMSAAQIDALRPLNRQAINAAIALAGHLGHSAVNLRRGTWPTDNTINLDQAGLTLRSAGAVIDCNMTSSAPVIALTAPGAKIGGLVEARITSGDGTPWNLEVNAEDCQVEGIRLNKVPDAGGYQAYVRKGARGIVMNRFSFRGSNGMFVEASDATFTNFDLVAREVGGDDCFALKAINGDGITRNVVIGNGRAKNFAYGLSIGSEIGTLAANDPSFAKGVFDVVYSDVALENCSGVLFIKPGTVSIYDWRDGTVDGVTVSNVTLRDKTGLKFQRAVALTTARGGRIRNVEVSGVVVTARAYTDGSLGPTVGTVDCYNIDYTGVSSGINAPDIRNVRVRMRFNDPFGGAATGPGTPGFPVQYLARFENQTSGHGTMSKISIDIDGDGAKECGILIGAGLDNALTIERADIANCSMNPSSGSTQGGVIPLSSATVRNLRVGALSNGYPFGGPSFTGKRHKAQQTVIPVGDIPAGSGVVHDAVVWVANRRSYIQYAYFVDAAGKPVHPTNFVTLDLINQITAGAFVTGATNSFTLNQHAQVGFYFTAAIGSANALSIPAGGAVRLRATGSGAGMALDDLRVVIGWIEHGE